MTTAAANTLKTSFVAGRTGPLAEAPWSGLVPADLWASFQAAVSTLDQAGVPFLLHGAFALATYTGHWRNTKDIDIIVHPGDHERAIDAIRRAGFEDYFDRLAYDRSWIFRALKNDGLIDIIWDLPNHRVPIDHLWFARAWPLHLRGRCYAAVPPEELVRVKLYVMQRERCDWVDVLNVLSGASGHIDWSLLVERMGRDLPLLHGVLALFNWMCPARAQALPAWVRDQFALPSIDADDHAAMEERRVALFDSRPWFALHQPLDRPLER